MARKIPMAERKNISFVFIDTIFPFLKASYKTRRLATIII